MADQGTPVPGIQASFSLDADQAKADLDKMKAQMTALADGIKAAQSVMTSLQAQINALGNAAGVATPQLQQIDVSLQKFTSDAIDFKGKIDVAADSCVTFAASASTGFTAATAAANVTAPTFTRVASAATMTKQEMEKLQSQARGLGMGLMQVGYAVDDLQYGFSAIVNNVGPMASSFAVAAGQTIIAANMIGAATQVFAVVAYQAVKNWDDATEALGLATNATMTHAEELEKLAHVTHKTADEQERYNKLKKEEREHDKLMSTRPKEERERNKAVEEAITDADRVKVQMRLREALIASGRAPKLNEGEQIAAYEKAEAEVDRNRLNPFHEDSEEALRDRTGLIRKKQREIINKTQDAQLDEMVAALMDKPEELTRLKTILKEFPSISPGLLESIEKAEKDPKHKLGKAETVAQRKKNEEIEKDFEQMQRDVDLEIAMGEEAKREKKQFELESKRKANEVYPEGVTHGQAYAKKQAAKGRTEGEIRDILLDLFTGSLQAQGLTEAEAKSAAPDLANKSYAAFIKHQERERIHAESPEGREQARQKAISERRRAGGEAEQAVPGIKDVAKDAMLRARAMGLSEDAASRGIQNEIFQTLKSQGFTGMRAANASREIAGEAGHDIQKEIVDRALGKGRKSGRNVEVFDYNDMNQRLQQAVGGGDPNKKAEEQRDKIINALAEGFKNQGRTIRLPNKS